MKYSARIMSLVCLLLLYIVIHTYAQEELGDEKPAPYTARSWYLRNPSPLRKGVSFFSVGYSYYYQNFDVDINVLNIGIIKEFYAETHVSALFYGLVGISVGYKFLYPLQVTKYELMQHIGQFELGWHPDNATLYNTSNIGLMNLYTQEHDELRSMRVYNNTSEIGILLLDMPKSVRIDANIKFFYDYAIDYDESIYEVYFDTVFVQSHGFGQLGIKPFVSYTDSIGTVSEIKPEKNFLKNTNFTVYGTIPFYNFAGGALLEYRFYFLNFLQQYKWYEDLYISATYNVAYLKQHDTEEGEVKMYYGGGLGVNIFGSFPLSAQFVMDEDFNMGFSIVSGIIPLY